MVHADTGRLQAVELDDRRRRSSRSPTTGSWCASAPAPPRTGSRSTSPRCVSDVTHDMGEAAALEKEGVEKDLQALLADAPEHCGEGFRLVRREWPTDIGPVDLMCRDADDGWVAVEIKRVATIDAVEQLTRYLERLATEPGLRHLPRRPGRHPDQAPGARAGRVARDRLRRGRPRRPARRARARPHPVRLGDGRAAPGGRRLPRGPAGRRPAGAGAAVRAAGHAAAGRADHGHRGHRPGLVRRSAPALDVDSPAGRGADRHRARPGRAGRDRRADHPAVHRPDQPVRGRPAGDRGRPARRRWPTSRAPNPGEVSDRVQDFADKLRRRPGAAGRADHLGRLRRRGLPAVADPGPDHRVLHGHQPRAAPGRRAVADPARATATTRTG